MKIQQLAGLTAAFLLACPALAQEEISFKSTQLADGLYMLEGVGGFTGGNLGLLAGADGVVLIDDGLEQYSAKLLTTVAATADAPVDFVINTHVHGDHVGGNAALHAQGARVVAHDSIRVRMLEADTAAAALPELTFTDEISFHLNGQSMQIMHVAQAHTDGDAVILFPDANAIHTGDVMFNGLFPFIDLDSGGTVSGFIEAQTRLIELSDEETRIIPGHGPLANRADLVRARDMLVDAAARVQALLDRGLDADAIKAANPLADYHDNWNWGFITTERMTETLLRALESPNRPPPPRL
ncbi:MAG: MBL fold metallo-hydrolase [Gammaproteobacteria bacterium]|nr:MBL fold metallo-hydrolase [Gammaproteobacteria bacterium]